MKLTKETLKRIIKEELLATMNEGHRGKLYDINPTLRPPHPSVVSDRQETPDFTDPIDQIAEKISNILMFDAGLGFSKSGTIAREVAEKLQEKGFDLTNYLTNKLRIPAAQASEIADKIMMEINQ